MSDIRYRTWAVPIVPDAGIVCLIHWHSCINYYYSPTLASLGDLNIPVLGKRRLLYINLYNNNKRVHQQICGMAYSALIDSQKRVLFVLIANVGIEETQRNHRCQDAHHAESEGHVAEAFRSFVALGIVSGEFPMGLHGHDNCDATEEEIDEDRNDTRNDEICDTVFVSHLLGVVLKFL